MKPELSCSFVSMTGRICNWEKEGIGSVKSQQHLQQRLKSLLLPLSSIHAHVSSFVSAYEWSMLVRFCACRIAFRPDEKDATQQHGLQS